MNDAASFAHEVAHDDDLRLVDEVVVCAWFLCQIGGQSSANFDDVLAFLKEWGIRTNINKSRVKSALRKNKQASLNSTGAITIPLKTANELKVKYAGLLGTPKPVIDDKLLIAKDFDGARKYVIEIVRQINGAYQFELYDAAATMMRRLAEVLIIDAFEAKRLDTEIRDTRDGHYVMMNGLISALRSGKVFKLGRNAPKQLETLKLIGDNAAHSRTYITKKKDIDDFAQNFRMLIEELKNLN